MKMTPAEYCKVLNSLQAQELSKFECTRESFGQAMLGHAMDSLTRHGLQVNELIVGRDVWTYWTKSPLWAHQLVLPVMTGEESHVDPVGVLWGMNVYSDYYRMSSESFVLVDTILLVGVHPKQETRYAALRVHNLAPKWTVDSVVELYAH